MSIDGQTRIDSLLRDESLPDIETPREGYIVERWVDATDGRELTDAISEVRWRARGGEDVQIVLHKDESHALILRRLL